jgi:2-C-methyl-D-erythritol 4-phosphate cytidylyltransferase/2-C-methyl-D-erythritol 2,4-cyclodiphosphate synthase
LRDKTVKSRQNARIFLRTVNNAVLNAPVNIKATTNEKMGFIGRGEGIAVISTTTLTYKDWYEDYNHRK